MKFEPKQVAITLVLSIILFVAAIYSYPFLFDHFIPKVDGAIYNITRFDTPFQQAKTFAIICGAVPILCYVLWKLIPITTNANRIISACLIIGGMITSVMIRRHFLQKDLNALARGTKEFSLNPGVNTAFENINFEYWLGVGMLCGTVFTFLFFRNKTKRWKK